MIKTISIIGTVGLPANYGGFETLTEYLTKYIENDFNLIVYCSKKNYEVKLEKYNNTKLKYINLNANGIQSIPYDIISILKSTKDSDVLLILGVSGCLILPFVKLISKSKIVVNIDGLEWKRDKWGKIAKKFLKFSEKLAVKYSDEIITDNKIIMDYVKSTYGLKSHLIAYGADHVFPENFDKKLINEYPFLVKDYCFKVCRIEPENNIFLILKSFSKLPNKKIVLIGNWNNSNYGKRLKQEFAAFKNIFLLDPIYNQKILNQIRSNCSIYIHGHSAGGTNPSLVEAMYLGLPIFAYDVEYNKETTQHKAGYFSNESELTKLLTNYDTKKLNIIASDMKIIAKKEYNWKVISMKYKKILN